MGTTKITYKPSVNYNVIAIASVLKDYRISFFINQELHLNFERVDDLLSEAKSKVKASSFAKYYYLDEKSDFEYFLVQNKRQGALYLKSLKNFDYLFVVKTMDEDTVDISSFFDKIKDVQEIQLALPLHELKPSERKLIERDL